MTKASKKLETDENVLPPSFAGLSSNRPVHPDIDRTTYHATDTGEFSMYVNDKWIMIEIRSSKK
jgi:hypothetical protein